MSIFRIFCFFIILVIIILLYSIILTEKRYGSISIVLSVIAVICLLFISADIGDAPTALDVYQGNTELRIIYEGKVPVDSVVIFKKKVHETK